VKIERFLRGAIMQISKDDLKELEMMLHTTLVPGLCRCGQEDVTSLLRGLCGYLGMEPLADPYNTPLPIRLPFARANFDSMLPADFYARAGLDFERMEQMAGPALFMTYDPTGFSAVVITVDGRWLKEHMDRLTAHGTPPLRTSRRSASLLTQPTGLTLAMLDSYLSTEYPEESRRKAIGSRLPPWVYPPVSPENKAATRTDPGGV
jgi:hypothetical protein